MSTAALFTLLVTGTMGICCVGASLPLVAVGVDHWVGCGLCGYLQGAVDSEKFFLDPSNLVVTSTVLGIGVLEATLIEAIWWIWAKKFGLHPRLLR
nr:hypothetical protein [Mycobacterium lepromatosis]